MRNHVRRSVGPALASGSLVLAAACGGGIPAGGDDPAAGVAAAVKQAITAQSLGVHVDSIVQHERLSGSDGENAAIDYIVGVLESDGIPVSVDTFLAYASDPLSARVEVVGGAFSPPAITVSFSGRVENLEGPLRDLGDADSLPELLTQTGERVLLQGEGPAGSTARPDRPDLRGVIALVTGTPGPGEATKLALLGVAGAVFINPEERLNDLTTTTVWGTPSLRDYHRIPQLPVAEIRRGDGDRLRAMLATGPIRVRLSADVRTGWKPLRLAVARVPGPEPESPYVLFGGHIDAWYHGGTDEGASNAAMLELARAFHAQRASLRRGLVVAWWPGHSNGRYAGSTWFVDHHFDEMRRRAVAYVNVDGIGQMSAKRFGAAATAALSGIARAAVLSETGDSVQPRPPGRNSDESFNGVGIPLLQLNHSRLAEDGGYWWWHTPDDTRDKVDLDVLKTDTDLYASAFAALLASPVLPIDPVAEVTAYEEQLRRVQERAGPRFDLSVALQRAERLLAAVRAAEGALPADPTEAVNLQRIEMLRPLYRTMFTLAGPYHPDPALDLGRLPGLGGIDVLAIEPPGSDLYGFTEATLVRERNRVLEALDMAAAMAERLNAGLQQR